MALGLISPATSGAPTALALDSVGNLFVTNHIEDTITKITPQCVISTFIADPGNGSVLNQPDGLAFDKAGNLYVANYGLGPGLTKNVNTITRFTPNGVESTFATTGLDGPGYMAFDACGNLFVDNFNDTNTIVKLAPDGTHSQFAFVPDQANGLAFDRAGNLFVGTNGGTVLNLRPMAQVQFLPVPDLLMPRGLNSTVWVISTSPAMTSF